MDDKQTHGLFMMNNRCGESLLSTSMTVWLLRN